MISLYMVLSHFPCTLYLCITTKVCSLLCVYNRLFNFPTEKSRPEARKRWITAINRADPKKPYAHLQPGTQSRVCSEHFVDGRPTADHPDPQLLLGKGNEPKQPKRRAGHIIRASCSSDVGSASCRPTAEPTESTAAVSELVSQKSVDASVDMLPFIALAITVLTLFSYACSMWNKYSKLVRENGKIKFKLDKLMREHSQLRSELRHAQAKLAKLNKNADPSVLLKNDSDTAFYTGIERKNIFDKLHDFAARFIRRRWRGFGYSCSMQRRKLHASPNRFGPKPKLNSKQEFLLTLMKLRLGLLNRDLSDRFGISLSLCSKTINTWVMALRKSIGHLVFWPSKEQVVATKPARFRNLPEIRAIIDCTELFIETPKDPALQLATWSEYKHHNTLKFLIAVAPNSAITFLSKCYCGRASDKAVTLHSKFLDKLDKYDMLQADKGFNIASDCEARLISLDKPPGKRGAPQLSIASCRKTKRIANQRILVEQIIRRLKTFRILQTEMPISLVPLADDIVAVCAALSNLKKPIYCD